MHARYLARNYDVIISQQIHYGIGYSEPRISDREKLLGQSIEDAADRWVKNVSSPHKRIFFIEDTSVIIHSLSKDEEYPGVDIKYWMKKNNFDSIDKMLKKKGNDRRVTVRSDILLYLPNHLREIEGKKYMWFNSSINGTICEQEHDIKTNPLYPWLDNKSFNKWFVPNGCNIPISMLPIHEADKYDFRLVAFKAILEYLEAKHIIRKKTITSHPHRQSSFLDSSTSIFLISGLPCAGKTTLGQFFSEKCGYYHIEASDFMYLSYYQRHGVSSPVSVADFAEQALDETPSIVVDQIIENLMNFDNIPVIITGFRSSKEIDSFVNQYEGPFEVKAVYIDAEDSLRFQRSLKRDRQDKVFTQKDYFLRDKQQLKMGLREIQAQLQSETILNNEDIDTYTRTFLNRYGLIIPKQSWTEIKTFQSRPSRLETAILLTLINNKEKINEFLTTTQIAHCINKFFSETSFKTSKNNVSRYFNQSFHPYYEIKVNNGKIGYRLSNTGRGRAMIMLRQNEDSQPQTDGVSSGKGLF